MFGQQFAKPVLASLFPILPLCAPGPPGQPDDLLPAVTVYVYFEEKYSDRMFAALKAEIEAIMGPIGLRFEWRSPEGVQDDIAFEVVVVTFNGKCGAGNPAPAPARACPGPLGRTYMSGADVLPFIEVECDRIRTLISSRLASVDCTQAERVFGRAVARVLAHELYHTFANTTRHAAAGLAKASFASSELVAPELRFQQNEADELRAATTEKLLRSLRASHAAEAREPEIATMR